MINQQNINVIFLYMRERGRGGAKLHNQVFYYYVIIQNSFNISVYEREGEREKRKERERLLVKFMFKLFDYRLHDSFIV